MSKPNLFTQPGADETAVGALLRFQQFLSNFQSQIEDNDDWKSDYELEIGPPIAATDFAEIEAFQAALGYRVPASLRAFYLEQGPFRLGSPENFAGAWLYSLTGTPEESWRTHFQSLMLAEHLMFHLGNRIRDEQKRHIGHHFRMFGAHFINDNVHEYWFFHRGGQGFGTLRIDQDYTTIEEVASLFGDPEEVCVLSLDDLIKSFVSDVIEDIQYKHNAS